MNRIILKTSEEWNDYVTQNYNFDVLDPDGWDRRNWDYSWNQEQISLNEFGLRCLRSTVKGISEVERFGKDLGLI